LNDDECEYDQGCSSEKYCKKRSKKREESYKNGEKDRGNVDQSQDDERG